MTLNLNHSTIVEDLEFNLSKARRHLHFSFRIPPNYFYRFLPRDNDDLLGMAYFKD